MSLPHKSSRLTELDSLRFFAVVGVMAVHFSPGKLAHMGPWGLWGVRFFFVLSGFLITQLLLSARKRVDARQSRAAMEFVMFCMRRALRLWPTYLLAVVGAALVGLAYARDMLPWNLAFAGNYYIVRHDLWPSLMSHLWTLAVEQQFYVLWPLLILLAPSAGITMGLWMLILAGPLFRAAEMIWGTGSAVHFALLPSCVDYFAWGGLLAWILSHPSVRIQCPSPRTCGWVSGVVFISCFAGFHLGVYNFGPALWSALEGTLIAVASVLLIRHCAAPQDSWLKAGLRQPVFVYLGRISYGIYLYHNFVHWLGPGLLRRVTGLRYFSNEWAHVLYYMCLAIVISSISWHLLERPLERLRHRLPTPVTS
ncbi:MAG: acyltransferase [Opitutaceae bacterium]|jgi:peptidoglycan/LPS O-acetylase OafA/YrhL